MDGRELVGSDGRREQATHSRPGPALLGPCCAAHKAHAVVFTLGPEYEYMRVNLLSEAEPSATQAN